MDLIYTNSRKIDQGVLSAYSLDMSFGDDENENDFELVIGDNEATLEDGSFIYFEGTEYGGIVDGMKTNTDSETTTHIGRTWHGILNSKVIEPDSGEDYLVVSGDANEVLAFLISRLCLSGLFVASEELSGINISKYQFTRYCKGYDGIRAMLAESGSKLKIKWEIRSVVLYAEPIADYSEEPVDSDIAPLTVERHGNKVNHLVCLGSGELSERDVIHLYVDQFGRIGDAKYYTGIEEFTEVYDYSNTESLDELKKGGISRLKELRDNDRIEISIESSSGVTYDIGDIIGAIDNKSGNSATATVIQKIVKINNGTISIEYKTGR